MVYRNDVDALEARHRALEAELAERVRECDEVARMLREARAREREHVRLAAMVAGPAGHQRWALIAAALLVLIAILGMVQYRKESRHAHRMHQMLERFEAWADDVCRCQDTACTQRTIDEMTAWSSNRAAIDRQMSLPIDGDTSHKFQVIAERFSRCMTRIVNPAASGQAEAQAAPAAH